MRKGDLLGKTVIAVEEATRLGVTEDIVFDQDGQLHAVVINRGWLRGPGAVPIGEIVALGPDVITVTTKAAMQDPRRIPTMRGLPSLRGALDCRVLTLGGKLLGLIDDVNVDGFGRRILTYELRKSTVVGMLLDEVSGGKATIPYIGRMRYGKDAVVVPGSVIGDRPLSDLETRLQDQWVGPSTAPIAGELVAATARPAEATESTDEALASGKTAKVIRIAEVQ